MFGLILMDVVINDEKWWGSGRYEIDGRPIKGKTYFVLKNFFLLR